MLSFWSTRNSDAESGIKDPDRAIDLIGRTAELEFKLVDSSAPLDLSQRIAAAMQSGQLKRNFNHQDLNQALKDFIPPGDELYVTKPPTGGTGIGSAIPILLKKSVLLTGEALKTARSLRVWR